MTKQTEDDSVYEEWELNNSDNPWVMSYLAKKRLADTVHEIRYRANLPARLADTPCFKKFSCLTKNKFFAGALLTLPILALLFIIARLILGKRLCIIHLLTRKFTK